MHASSHGGYCSAGGTESGFGVCESDSRGECDWEFFCEFVVVESFSTERLGLDAVSVFGCVECADVGEYGGGDVCVCEGRGWEEEEEEEGERGRGGKKGEIHEGDGGIFSTLVVDGEGFAGEDCTGM